MSCTLTVYLKNLDINKQEYRSEEYKLELSYHAMHYHYWFLNQIQWALQHKIAMNEDSK